MSVITRHITRQRIRYAFAILTLALSALVLGYCVLVGIAARNLESGFGDEDIPPYSVFPSTHPPQWSADGKRILFGSSIVETGGNDNEIKTINDVVHPSLSPNGTRLAFATYRHGDNYEIGVSNFDGSKYRRLTKSEISESNPVWSSDGSQIVFSSGDLHIMDADGSNVRRLAGKPYVVGLQAWSPNGAKLAFLSVQFTPSQLYEDASFYIETVEADGSNPTRLGESARVPPAWSPDGSTIAFLSKDGFSLLAVNSDGSGLRELVAIKPDSLPSRRPNQTWRLSWSPDGSEILLQDYPFIRVKADGSGYGVFTGLGGVRKAYASWSPDGSRIAVDIRQYHGSMTYSGSGVRLFTMAREGTNKSILITSHVGPPDERGWRETWLEPAHGEPLDRLTRWEWHEASGKPILNPR